jgi:hypothetical protein
VDATPAGFEVVCGEVIEPQPDEPNPPYASGMAVADIPFESDVSPDRRPHTSDHTCCRLGVKKYFIYFNNQKISLIS